MLTLTCCQDHILTENIWFVCSETSYSGDERRCYRCGTTKRRTTEDRATQPMEAGGWASQFILAKFPISEKSICGVFWSLWLYYDLFGTKGQIQDNLGPQNGLIWLLNQSLCITVPGLQGLPNLLGRRVIPGLVKWDLRGIHQSSNPGTSCPASSCCCPSPCRTSPNFYCCTLSHYDHQ